MAQKTIENMLLWLPRALVLMAIWGVAVFLWGTFGAWTEKQYVTQERALLLRHMAETQEWLQQALRPLDPLATDPRIATALELPAGVESLPAQRILYEYGYLTRQSEVYLVDLLRKRVGKTAGAAPLPAEVTQRLADLPDSPRLLMGMGARNGQMLLVRKVAAPLPNRLVAVIPVSLATLGGGRLMPRLPEARELGLVVPHQAGWADWRDGQQGFVLDPLLADAVERRKAAFETPPFLSLLEAVPGWPAVYMSLQSPGSVSGTRLLPQLLVALWALAMSLLVAWRPIYREKALAAAAPLLKPLGKLTAPLSGGIHSLSDAIAVRWNAANKEAPLVDGPGDFASQDFLGQAQLDSRRPRKARAAKPLKLTQAAPTVGGKAAPKQPPPARTAKPMAWPDAKPPTPPAEQVDTEDMRALVEDCLRKKRLKLLYQPIYRAADNLPVMHEVYARLLRPNGGIITPDAFLPVATQHKMVLELDLIVLRKVVHEHFAHHDGPVTPLALNISSTSLDGLAYLQEMSNQGPRVLRKMGFEVRSQEMIRDPKALKLLKDLQKHGGNLAVDYFGGGTAMLDASKSLGFNYVKINCSKFIGTDAGRQELTRLCEHAKVLQLPIILEMIGDAAAEAFARKCGAEFLQGYRLGRPGDHLTTAPLTPDLSGMQQLAEAPNP